MVGIIGRKMGMTQVFAEDGSMVPVTVIQAGPCWVVQKKEKGKDGYDALQLGYGQTKESRATKPLQGHFKKASVGALKHLREIRDMDAEAFQVGQEIRVDIFSAGDLVDVIGTTRGKGFAGGVKRHGYRGGADTHGSMFHRAPGSIGASSYPSRVFKGRKLPGHMGSERQTIKGLRVIRVDRENNMLLVMGAVPGSPRSLLTIVNPGAGDR